MSQERREEEIQNIEQLKDNDDGGESGRMMSSDGAEVKTASNRGTPTKRELAVQTSFIEIEP